MVEARFAQKSRDVRLALVGLLLLVACGAGRSAVPVKTGAAAQGRRLLLVRGTIVRADGSEVTDAVVTVEGNRITRVGWWRNDAVPPGATVIGGPRTWLLPGLIDAHVHFFQSGGLYTRPDVIDLRARVSYEKERESVRAALPETFRRYLRAGITSVVDFGGPRWNFEVRDLARRTELAPRVAIAGPLLASVARPQLDLGDPPIVEVNDPDSARAIVRSQAAGKPDFVKLWWIVSPGQSAADWLPVARAAIEEAHALGLRVAVHATELETARAALRAGADVLVHSVIDADVDADFVELLRERNVPYVTTLAVFGGYERVLNHEVRLDAAAMELASPSIVSTVLEPFVVPQGRYREPLGPEAARNVRRLWTAGAVVVAGSDAGNIGTFHAAGLHEELELLVESGLSPAQALAAATVNGARLMGRSDLGAPDLLVLDANPLVDVRNARRIRFVVKDGVAYRPEEILRRTAVDVVQAQLNAYNAQDLEAFLSTYAEDAVIVKSGTGKVLASGRTALRERYGALFKRFPSNRARVAERKTEGEGVVLDHEVVTGRGPEKPDPWDSGWVRYEVASGVIRRVELP